MSNPMGLNIPTPLQTPGPDYASQVSDDLDTIASHDHTTGKGNPVPVAGLNINADLPLGGNNATGARSYRMNSQSGPLVLPGDLGCIYVVSGDLYYNNGAGVSVRLTNGGSIVGAGGITGLVAPAAVVYNPSDGSFTFISNTNVRATLKVGPLLIADTAAGAKSITLQSPTGLAADYAVTLFDALPASESVVTLDATGVLRTRPQTVAAGSYPSVFLPNPLGVTAQGLVSSVSGLVLAKGGMAAVTGTGWLADTLITAPNIAVDSGAWSTALDSGLNQRMRYSNSSAASGDFAIVESGFKATLGFPFAGQRHVTWQFAVDNTHAGLWWAGLSDNPANIEGNTNPSSRNVAGFRFDSSTDAKWKAYTSNGSGVSVDIQDTGISPVAGNVMRMTLVLDPAGSVMFYLQDITAAGPVVALKSLVFPGTTQVPIFFVSGHSTSANTIQFSLGKLVDWVGL